MLRPPSLCVLTERSLVPLGLKSPMGPRWPRDVAPTPELCIAFSDPRHVRPASHRRLTSVRMRSSSRRGSPASIADFRFSPPGVSFLLLLPGRLHCTYTAKGGHWFTQEAVGTVPPPIPPSVNVSVFGKKLLAYVIKSLEVLALR